MLVGLILRHYKVYKNLHLIPISYGAKFTSFLGTNGIGKTSIFEALDKFFNGGEWSINHESKFKSESENSPFIAPVFLIPKTHKFNSSEEIIATSLSDYFWGFSETPYSSFISGFKEIRDNLKSSGFNKETHYLIAIGQKHQSGDAYFSFFENGVKNALELGSNLDPSHFSAIIKSIKNYYRYIYLPAEADSLHFARMESSYVQKLLDEDIKRKIQNSIGKKSVAEINEKLELFISEINKSLEKYTYRGKLKNKLTVNDLVERVFEAYFGIKILHKKHKGGDIAMGDLSSGEKRQALIDLSHSLISRSPDKDHQIVLAIDEPDASMHISACHDQFEKISKIPSLSNPETQVLVNTHWYGFIPIIQDGIAHSLTKPSEKIEFFSFDLNNFREHINQQIKGTKGQNPTEVELKSYQDMIQSVVVSMVRGDPYHWLFCEGLSDKIYLGHYLSDLTNSINLRIVPLGGFKEVRRVYKYLCAPLSEKEANFNGSATCLVDTDSQKENVDVDPNVKNLYFKRIVRDDSTQKVVLVNADSQFSFPTEIEMTLDGIVFQKVVLSDAAKDLESYKVLHQVHDSTDINSEASNLYDFLNLSPANFKKIMQDFFDIGKNKVDFAKIYVACDPEKKHTPEWIKSLRDVILLGSTKKPQKK